MESLEVIDNGSGLDPSDYETLGKMSNAAQKIGIINVVNSSSPQALYIQDIEI